MARDQRGRFTAERTTTTTRTVTERVTIEASDNTTAPVAPVPGWAAVSDATGSSWERHREDQLMQCLDLLRIAAMSSSQDKAESPVQAAIDAGDLPAAAAAVQFPPSLRRQEAVTVLLAGPDASPMERALGRS